MIETVEFKSGSCQVTVENDAEKQKSCIGVDYFTLTFKSKQEVVDHIALLNKALEFWEYEDCCDKEHEVKEMPIFEGTLEKLDALGELTKENEISKANAESGALTPLLSVGDRVRIVKPSVLVDSDWLRWIPEMDKYDGAETHVISILPICLLYTSPSPRDQRGSRMPSSA